VSLDLGAAFLAPMFELFVGLTSSASHCQYPSRNLVSALFSVVSSRFGSVEQKENGLGHCVRTGAGSPLEILCFEVSFPALIFFFVAGSCAPVCCSDFLLPLDEIFMTSSPLDFSAGPTSDVGHSCVRFLFS
jgi:hypothetical protein